MMRNIGFFMLGLYCLAILPFVAVTRFGKACYRAGKEDGNG